MGVWNVVVERVRTLSQLEEGGGERSEVGEKSFHPELLFLRMIIKGIKLDGYRGFYEADTEFDPHLNVLVGVNGSGKTTVLEAIVKTLAQFTQEFAPISDEFERGFVEISTEEINYDKKDFSIGLDVALNGLSFHLDENPFSDELDEVYIEFSNRVDAFQPDDVFHFGKPRSDRRMDDLVQNLNIGGFGTSPSTIPILRYYPIQRNQIRMGNMIREEVQVYEFSQLETWGKLIQTDASFADFFQWFYEQETEELRAKGLHGKVGFEIPSLKHIRSAMGVALGELFSGNFTIQSAGKKRHGSNVTMPSLDLVFLDERDPEGSTKREPLENKSAGEKAIITLIADIAYNLSIAKDFSRDDDFLSSPGVVLIDEIEAHLHPKWQREIVPLLRKVFPNIQFFITTHSPQVIASVDSKHLIVCDDFKFSKINFRTLGADSNSILKYIFETTERPKEILALIQRFDDLIDEEASLDALRTVKDEIQALWSRDQGLDNTILMDELDIRLNAYAYDQDAADQ